MTEQLILNQLYFMPENLKVEVLDFTNYLITKYQLKKQPKKYPVFGSVNDDEKPVCESVKDDENPV